MKALLKAEWINLWRNWPFFILGVGMPLGLFLIFASINSTHTAGNEEATLSYMLQMTSFSMSSFALFSFPIMLKEDQNNHYLSYIEHSPLPITYYYLAKVIRVFMYFISSILLIFVVSALLEHVKMSATRWIVCAVLLFFTSLLYLAIGLLVGQIKNMQTMSVASNIVFLGLAILGGTWFPVKLFPDWLQQVSQATPSYYVNELVTKFGLHGTFDTSFFIVVLINTIGILFIALFIKKKTEVA